MALDVNEVIANTIVGIGGIVFSWVGSRIHKFISKVNKAEKDLNAVFPKIRRIEAVLGIKEECGVRKSVCENGTEASNGGLHQQGNGLNALGDK